MTTTQSVAKTTTTSNAHATIATINPASTPKKEAESAIPVPGLTDPSSEEQAAEPRSDVSPKQVVRRVIEAHYMSH